MLSAGRMIWTIPLARSVAHCRGEFVRGLFFLKRGGRASFGTGVVRKFSNYRELWAFRFLPGNKFGTLRCPGFTLSSYNFRPHVEAVHDSAG